MPITVAMLEGVSYHMRYSRIPQPDRSGGSFIHLAVQGEKGPARRQSGAGASACQPLRPSSWEGASQTPSNKQKRLFVDIGMPVREPPTIEHSELAGESACPTYSALASATIAKECCSRGQHADKVQKPRMNRREQRKPGPPTEWGRRFRLPTVGLAEFAGGSRQTPSNKQKRLFADIGMPVREPPTIEHSELAGESACPTYSALASATIAKECRPRGQDGDKVQKPRMNRREQRKPNPPTEWGRRFRLPTVGLAKFAGGSQPNAK